MDRLCRCGAGPSGNGGNRVDHHRMRVDHDTSYRIDPEHFIHRDPPRPDARALISELKAMGVATLMITGDAPSTAAAVAAAVGLDGSVCSGPIPATLQPGQYAVFAGVFPEDKYHIVRALQNTEHTVGMCGDGANDAPALRQAQMGVAVSTATDVAKSAAGLVLTEAGLGVSSPRCSAAASPTNVSSPTRCAPSPPRSVRCYF